MKDELLAGQPKISSKKQKRLYKYIENKLKKDENLELIRKLSREKAKFDPQVLQSSKNLGKRKHAQFVADQKSRETGEVWPHEALGSEVDSQDSFKQENETAFEALEGTCTQVETKVFSQAVAAGSGLREPLQFGSDGFPVLEIRQRKRRKAISSSKDELNWEGFDTGDDVIANETMDELDTGCLKSPKGKIFASDLEDYKRRESEDAEETEVSESSYSSNTRIKPRNSAFKAWATQQVNKSLDYSPQLQPENIQSVNSLPNSEEILSDRVELGCDASKINFIFPPTDLNQSECNAPSRKAHAIPVTRTAQIQERRLRLPIVAEEQKIMEAIHNNPIVVLWGATGSGKTTQVPQFLFETGYGDTGSSTPGMIGVTQPRRIAAVSMANRVREELGQHGGRVSYQIRFESTVYSNTAIKFMTDGILLREISQDLSLEKYSAIIIDEAHERSVNTDILISMLSRIVDARTKLSKEDSSVKPLKLVIMSATMRIDDFIGNNKLFRTGIPPLVSVEGRTFPVTIHFARRTRRDYVEEAYRKIVKGHRKLPPGGMLVFLTSPDEIKTLHRRLQATFAPEDSKASLTKVRVSATEMPLETEDFEVGGVNSCLDDNEDENIDIITGVDEEADEGGEFDIGQEQERRSSTQTESVHLLPLYSQLPTKSQLRIFDPSPSGSRLIVLATNVAETSLTIPGIRYVFDCGRCKQRLYDEITGVQRFEIGWISKASAAQRAGRAGRNAPGHCWRLYSSAVFEQDFAEYADPEILRTSMETVVLQMKSMGIDRVANFPFPTPPARQSLLKAEKLLQNLGALSSNGQVTSLGQQLSKYPLSPRYGKMLSTGTRDGCLPYVIALVAGLSVADLFIPENQIDMTPTGYQEDHIYRPTDHHEEKVREEKRRKYNKSRAILSKYDKTCDALKILTAVCGYEEKGDKWCEEAFLRPKALREVSQLREQLTNIIRANDPVSCEGYNCRLPPPSAKQIETLKETVAAGFVDQVAIRADLAPKSPEAARVPGRAIDVPYLPLFPVNPLGDVEEKVVFIHPSSVCARLPQRNMPTYLIYSHLQLSQVSHIDNSKSTPKIRMFPLTATNDAVLARLAHDTPLVTYGKPIGKIEHHGDLKRECWVVPSLVNGLGNLGWPLTARKVLQRKDSRMGWVMEKFFT